MLSSLPISGRGQGTRAGLAGIRSTNYSVSIETNSTTFALAPFCVMFTELKKILKYLQKILKFLYQQTVLSNKNLLFSIQ